MNKFIIGQKLKILNVGQLGYIANAIYESPLCLYIRDAHLGYCLVKHWSGNLKIKEDNLEVVAENHCPNCGHEIGT